MANLSSTQYSSLATAIFEDEVVQQYDIDWNGLLEFLKELVPFIMELPCFAMMNRRKDKIRERLEDSYRDVRRGKKSRIPKAVRKFMDRHDYSDEELQYAIWDKASEQAFLNAESYSTTASR